MRDNLRGILLMVASMAGFAVEDMFIKWMAIDLPTGQILLALAATLLVGTPTLSLIGGLAAALTPSRTSARTATPCAASCCTTARPTPPVAPATSTVRPCTTACMAGRQAGTWGSALLNGGVCSRAIAQAATPPHASRPGH